MGIAYRVVVRYVHCILELRACLREKNLPPAFSNPLGPTSKRETHRIGLEDSDDLPDPEIIAQEIADDLQTALEQFQTIATSLRNGKQ